MGMRRSTLRQHVFSVLFRVEFHNLEDMNEQIELYCNELVEAGEEDVAFITNRAKDVVSKLEQIDEKLADCSEGWDIDRIGKVELTILRLALYEILFDEDVPNAVAVNEAVELSKKFGQDSSYSFVNGVLSKAL